MIKMFCGIINSWFIRKRKDASWATWKSMFEQGATVNFPPGTYQVPGQLNFPAGSNVSITGSTFYGSGTNPAISYGNSPSTTTTSTLT